MLLLRRERLAAGCGPRCAPELRTRDSRPRFAPETHTGDSHPIASVVPAVRGSESARKRDLLVRERLKRWHWWHGAGHDDRAPLLSTANGGPGPDAARLLRGAAKDRSRHPSRSASVRDYAEITGPYEMAQRRAQLLQ